MSVPIGPQPQRDHSRIKVRARPIAAPAIPKASRSVPISVATNACRTCGAKLARRKRVFCDACLPEHREETREAHGKKWVSAGVAKIAAMRAQGHDPTNTLEARRRRSATASEQRRASVAWRDDGSLDRVDFKRDILPKLQGLPVRVIAEAMGVSISHGSKVRNGHLIPHKRHWEALIAMLGGSEHP